MNRCSLEIVTNCYDTLNKVLDSFVDSIVWKKEIVTNCYDTLNKMLDSFVDSIVWKKEHVVACRCISSHFRYCISYPKNKEQETYPKFWMSNLRFCKHPSLQ